MSEIQPTAARSEALLAQILMHFLGDAGLRKKALILRASGFTNSEIAALLSTTPEVISQSLYVARREAKPKRKTSSAAKRKGTKR